MATATLTASLHPVRRENRVTSNELPMGGDGPRSSPCLESLPDIFLLEEISSNRNECLYAA